jgi:uncharacterized protein (DUF2345 family)
MLKSIRLAAVGFAVCFAMTAGAQDTVKVGKDGVKVNSGGNQVDIGGGKVNVQAQGSNTQVEEEDEVEEDATGTTTTSGSDINILGSSRKGTFGCTGNTVVAISGSANDITLTGECKSVSVAGSANKVSMDGVGEINVSGSSNNVTWKRASGDAKKPKVNAVGVGNKVAKAK